MQPVRDISSHHAGTLPNSPPHAETSAQGLARSGAAANTPADLSRQAQHVPKATDRYELPPSTATAEADIKGKGRAFETAPTDLNAACERPPGTAPTTHADATTGALGHGDHAEKKASALLARLAAQLQDPKVHQVPRDGEVYRDVARAIEGAEIEPKEVLKTLGAAAEGVDGPAHYRALASALMAREDEASPAYAHLMAAEILEAGFARSPDSRLQQMYGDLLWRLRSKATREGMEAALAKAPAVAPEGSLVRLLAEADWYDRSLHWRPVFTGMVACIRYCAVGTLGLGCMAGLMGAFVDGCGGAAMAAMMALKTAALFWVILGVPLVAACLGYAAWHRWAAGGGTA